MPKKTRVTYRRGSDVKVKVWIPIIVQAGMLLLACSGLYYGLTQKQAVQAALFDERTGNLNKQIDSLQRNVEGLQRYVIDLHRQEEKR